MVAHLPHIPLDVTFVVIEPGARRCIDQIKRSNVSSIHSVDCNFIGAARGNLSLIDAMQC